MSEAFYQRDIYLNELNTLEHWARLIGTYKGNLGFIGYFDQSMSQTSASAQEPAGTKQEPNKDTNVLRNTPVVEAERPRDEQDFAGADLSDEESKENHNRAPPGS